MGAADNIRCTMTTARRKRKRSSGSLIRSSFEDGRWLLRMVPNFVPRRFVQPGRRLRLHPDDYFALGTARGAIKERWFSSVIPAHSWSITPDQDDGLPRSFPSVVMAMQNDRLRTGAAISTRPRAWAVMWP